MKNQWVCAGLFLLITTVPAHAQPPLMLRGTIVTPSAIIEDGTITVSGGTIGAVLPWTAGASDGAVDVGGVIFPGLIDLHNHITWNALPRFTPPSLTRNRYEWQEMPEYAKALNDPPRRGWRRRWRRTACRSPFAECTPSPPPV